ncbi:MAG: hypothetical protein ABFD82_18495 [Syntrophaceae bacterium]
MKTTINSRKHGEVTFSRPGKHYVYVDLNGKPGTLGNQICDGGELSGSTITFEGEDQATFDRSCRSWWKQYLKKQAYWGDPS